MGKGKEGREKGELMVLNECSFMGKTKPMCLHECVHKKRKMEE